MSKFYFNFLNINLFNCLFVTSSVGLKEVSHSLKNGWFAHYRCLQYRASSDKKRSRDCCKAWIKIRNCDGVVLTSVELF